MEDRGGRGANAIRLEQKVSRRTHPFIMCQYLQYTSQNVRNEPANTDTEGTEEDREVISVLSPVPTKASLPTSCKRKMKDPEELDESLTRLPKWLRQRQNLCSI